MIRRLFTRAGEMTAHPWALAIVAIYALGWLIFERETFDWHAGATLATWVMTLFIQRAEQSDTQAQQAKLDEILERLGADDRVVGIDREEVEEIEAEREHRGHGRSS
ncbi:MAG: hypothetical protein EON96_19080 [Caulobacteraceae bacterium]|nr:MAG: hypothetical protein EON96_19080 [Caulobacteraceae bacterium]